VEKVYSGGVKALDDLKLEVKEGEFMVLVGPSGCGKSTALRSIAGLEEITGGTISIGGRVVNDLPPEDRDIATVFQNYALYPRMTVADNLAFGLKLRHTPKAEIKWRVGEVAEMLGLEPYLNRKPPPPRRPPTIPRARWRGAPPDPSSQIPALSPYAGPQDLGWRSGTPNWCQGAGDGSRYW
jgi:hypothetical protein